VTPKIREYIYFALGLLGAIWFFVGYPSQDPRSVIDISETNVETVKNQATDKLQSLGYNSSNFNLKTRFFGNRNLLDSLQSKMGRDKMINRYRGNGYPNVELFYWEASFSPLKSAEEEIVIGAGNQSPEDYQLSEEITIRFNQSGEFLELSTPKDMVHPNVVSRTVIASIFGANQDSAQNILSGYSDSVITRSIRIDLQPGWSRADQPVQSQENQLKEALQSENTYRLSTQDVFDMATHYLQQTGWNTAEFEQDTVQLGRVNGTNITTASFTTSIPELGQDLSLDVRLTATGALLGISSSYNFQARDQSNGGLWSVIKDALVLLFILSGIILFFFRIRARAIDTRPALVVSILSGLALSVLMILFLIPKTEFLFNTDEWTGIIELLVASGVSGAGGSLAFFMFFAIGDSITRQHWPEKLNVYDYLRQGMVFNKPVGFMLVRSVMLAFILAGLWTFILWLLPSLYLDLENEIFLSQQSVWSPLYVLLSNGVLSFSIILGIFLVLGGQTLAQTKSKVFASAIIVLACGIVVPYSGSLGPSLYQLIVGIILGVALLYIYLEWDFLTLFLSHFLFLGLVSTVTGWVIEGSLDSYLFIENLGLMAVLLLSGFVAVGQGKEEKVLPRYVPQYVEELAQEERIKQELQIAREVQQSFLPVQTPRFEGLELAAMCQPAFETGGDYYDFVSLDENRIAVTIGDVSGKGIQAAFFMTFVKGILHSLCREFDSPSEILKKTNRLFCENAPRGTFISLVFGIIDLEKQTFHFARAGHNPILRLNSDNGSVKKLQPKGIGIGLTKTDSFDKNIEEVELNLIKDDVLVLYTDGIVEALNENKKFYGEHRLNNILLRNKERSAADILQEVSHDVRSYIGDAKQHDDMTMVIIKLEKN
jgi:hypothetical protein